jgi:outer membrane protein assembly factor BamB
MRSFAATFAVLSLSSASLLASDWPHWRGPARDGTSADEHLPLEWSTTEGITWQLTMPTWSGSTPIVSGDRIFVSTADGGARAEGRRPAHEADKDPAAERLSLWCIDRGDGSVVWRRPLGGGNHQLFKHNMSSPSPVTDGKNVWVMTGTGLLRSFTFDGTLVWSRDLQAEYGPFGLNWGYASSPTLHEGSLYIQVLHGMKTDAASYVEAIDAATGKTRWHVERSSDAPGESPDAYATPVVLQHDGRTEIGIAGGDVFTGHDPETGAELWRLGGMNPDKAANYRVVASPISLGNLLIVPTRVKPLQVFQLGSDESGTTTELLWSTDSGPDVPTPVSDGERVYIVRDNGVMLCLRARTGAVVWGPERIRGRTYSASPVLADGRLYVTAEDGVTSVIRAGDTFEVLAENELEGYTLSSPAISEGQIFIRTEKFLYCIGERRSESS